MRRARLILHLATRPARRLKSVTLKSATMQPLTDWALNALSAAVDVPPELLKLSRAERAALLALLRADLKAKLRLRNLMRARFRRGGSVRPDDHRAG